MPAPRPVVAIMFSLVFFGQSQAAPWLPSVTLVFHECPKNCLARRAVAISKPMDLKSYGPRDPVAIHYCRLSLMGQPEYINLAGKVRGVCQFRDRSSVELKGIQLGLDSKRVRRP